MRVIASHCMLSDNEPTTYLCIIYRRADRYVDGRAYGWLKLEFGLHQLGTWEPPNRLNV